VTGAWWCPWSSKPVWGSQGSRVGSIPIRLRQLFPRLRAAALGLENRELRIANWCPGASKGTMRLPPSMRAHIC